MTDITNEQSELSPNARHRVRHFATILESFFRRELVLPTAILVVALYLFLPRYQLASVQVESGDVDLYMRDMRTSDVTKCVAGDKCSEY